MTKEPLMSAESIEFERVYAKEFPDAPFGQIEHARWVWDQARKSAQAQIEHAFRAGWAVNAVVPTTTNRAQYHDGCMAADFAQYQRDVAERGYGTPTKPYNVVDQLRTPEEITEFLLACVEEAGTDPDDVAADKFVRHAVSVAIAAARNLK